MQGRALSWVWKEFKEMLPAACFFLITFHMIALTKAVVLSTHGVTAIKASIATIAALMVAKAILIVDKLPIANLFDSVVWHNIIWRTLLFYVVTMIFHLLESTVSFYLQPGSNTFRLGEVMEWISWQYFAVVQMWLISLLGLFTLVREIIQIVGHEQLVKLITERRR